MRRIYPEFAYGPGPRDSCWWDETIPAPTWPVAEGSTQVEVAIIGGGFTGISAALHLAESGVEVAVFEAQTPGWGASGRNGGFCCLGGGMLDGSALVRRYGIEAARSYGESEVAAVELSAELIAKHQIQADTHSKGETIMAHSPKAMAALRKSAEALATEGQDCALLEQTELAGAGLQAGFFGALTLPIGFGLNPRKYLLGLAAAAQRAGAALFQNSPVLDIKQVAGGVHLRLNTGSVRAKKLILATNGYSSEDLPDWLRARYLPSQSSVLVTRPLSEAELTAQGWISDQMAYDSRHLLHYFRLMPDRRFLFGMRGGLKSSPRAEARIRRQLIRHFHALFPAWRQVEVTHTWSGLVSLGASRVPFIGAVPQMPGVFAGLNYHGNGVAMGTYAGRLLSDLVRGVAPSVPYSPAVQALPRFPLGRFRRALLPAAYGYYALKDASFFNSSSSA